MDTSSATGSCCVPTAPVRTDHVTLAQLPAARSIAEVRLHFDGGDSLDVQLGPESRTGAGQLVTFPARTVGSLAVEILRLDIPDIDPLPRSWGSPRSDSAIFGCGRRFACQSI